MRIPPVWLGDGRRPGPETVPEAPERALPLVDTEGRDVRIADIQATIVSIPYRHRENSSQISRDGVTDIVVKVTTDDGVVGWGESCSGADVTSVRATIDALVPIVLGRDPWNRGAIHADAHMRGLWNFREPTFNFAFAGIDMALWDICARSVGRSVADLLGGCRRRSVDYFCYLPFGADEATLEDACRQGHDADYRVFYIKVGKDIEQDEANLALVRRVVGPQRRIRIDANGAWSVAEALRNLERLDRFGLDFAEQPVPADPIEGMKELKTRTHVPLAANEGLWRAADAWQVITQRAADVLVFSSYWVGSVERFAGLSWAAAMQGLAVCKHTHGELGIAAAAAQQVLLTLPSIVEGNQQTAALVADDVLMEPLPIASGPTWTLPEGPSPPGLGIEVDEAAVARWHEAWQRDGQFLPYRPDQLAADDPAWHARRAASNEPGEEGLEGRVGDDRARPTGGGRT
jgi:L-Ala-D/L-Glu epimerase